MVWGGGPYVSEPRSCLLESSSCSARLPATPLPQSIRLLLIPTKASVDHRKLITTTQLHIYFDRMICGFSFFASAPSHRCSEITSIETRTSPFRYLPLHCLRQRGGLREAASLDHLLLRLHRRARQQHQRTWRAQRERSVQRAHIVSAAQQQCSAQPCRRCCRARRQTLPGRRPPPRRPRLSEH